MKCDGIIFSFISSVDDICHALFSLKYLKENFRKKKHVLYKTDIIKI